MNPPAIHAAKNRASPPAAVATMAGVRKMPMPTTRLNTTIAVSKVESRARMIPTPCSAATQCFLEQARELFELAQIIVQLRRDAQQRHGIRIEPSLDSPCPEPRVQGVAIERVGGRPW